jgi:hypothetical protein
MLTYDDLHLYHFRLLDTDNVMVIPTGVTVRLLITSDDVLHSWAVPSFGVKVDAVPGRVNEYFLRVKYSGIYFGQCSEICGVNHAFMPIAVRSLPWNYFINWWQLTCVHMYRSGTLDQPFTIDYDKEVFCALADDVLKDLTASHGFVGHELHRLTLNAFYDGGFEVSKYLVYRQIVASIAIHTTGLKTYPMVFDRDDIEFMVYSIIKHVKFCEFTRNFYSPEYLLKHYKHIYIPKKECAADFNSFFGVERVSIFRYEPAFEAHYEFYGDTPAEEIKPISEHNFYPARVVAFSQWRDSKADLPILPKYRYNIYPTSNCYELMNRFVNLYSEVTQNDWCHLWRDARTYQRTLFWADLYKTKRMKGYMLHRFSWPYGTDVRPFVPVGTAYYIEEGLIKKPAPK